MKRCLLTVSFFIISFAMQAQIITTFAGTGSSSFSGDGGSATSAGIPNPRGGAFDKHGNYYYTDGSVNRVRQINTAGIIITIAGNGTGGFSSDGIAATGSELYYPEAVAFDTSGNLYIADVGNNRIRKVDKSTGIITTVAGTGSSGFSGDGGYATAAMLSGPNDICFDKYDNLYISDCSNQRVRKVNTSGIITTFAGPGSVSSLGDGGLATAAFISSNWGVTADTFGNVYIADAGSCRVRKVNTSGIISTFAGNGTCTYSGDGEAATNTQIQPSKLGIDAQGNMYISDWYNMRIYKIDTFNILYLIAGDGTAGSSGDGGFATAAAIDYPAGVGIDVCGNLYIPTSDDRRIRKVTFPPTPSDTPIVSISPGTSDTVCSGDSITFYASFTGTGTAGFQWYVNATAISAGTTNAYTYIPVGGDSVQCVVTASNACHTPSTGYSNIVHIVVNPLITPSIAIAVTPGDTVCAGTPVNFTATISGGGSAPSYRWLLNGTTASSTDSSYIYTPSNGDSVRCVLTSSAGCVTTATISSNMITMVVNPLVTPTIAISAIAGDTVCAGSVVNYTATISGGGSSPAYRWVVNGTVVSTTGSSYIYAPSNGDSVRCILTSTVGCPAMATVSSNTINMVVYPITVPTIHISASPGDSICNITTVTYTATLTGGGSLPSYKWIVDGVVVSTTGSIYTYAATSGDSARCILISDAPCASPDTLSSNMIHITVASLGMPTITLSGPSVVPIGSSVTITATVTDAGSSYVIHWMNNGIEFTTTTVPSVTYTKAMATDSISARIVSNDYCYDSTLSSGHLVWDHDASTPGPFSTSGEGVTCYPNPVHSELIIHAGFDIESVVVVDLVGRVVFQLSAVGSQLSVCDVSGLGSGVYFVKVYPAFSAGGNGVVVQKFIKE